MAGINKKARGRNFVNSVGFPRTVVAAAALIIGFMLFLGAISSADGQFTAIVIAGGIVYLIILGCVVGYLTYTAWRSRKTT